MKTIIAIALASTVLFAVAIPAAAFDTEDCGWRVVAWQVANKRIVNQMTTRPASIRRAVNSLLGQNNKLEAYMLDLEPNSCQTSAGYGSFKHQVSEMSDDLVGAIIAFSGNAWDSGKRYVSKSIRHYKNANNLALQIVGDCG